MLNHEHIFKKLLKGHCTNEEAASLIAFFETKKGADEMKNLFQKYMLQAESDEDEDMYRTFPDEKHLIKLREAINPPTVIRQSSWKRFIPYVAAAVLLIFFTVSYWKGSTPEVPYLSSEYQEILPAKNGATLIRANGQSILLDADQSGIKSEAGQISYTDGQKVFMQNELSMRKSEQLTLQIPRGGVYKVQLPDGTKVWLNAQSKLTYPSNFIDMDRVVMLEGEAYFEVATQMYTQSNGKQIRRPFRIQTHKQVVEVLGTHFNISAYTDESSEQTVLVEGSVQIKTNRTSKYTKMRPGQEAIISSSSIQLNEIDVSMYPAWKDGAFNFESQDIRKVMRMLERWYDVEVTFSGNPTTHRFSGTISKFENIDKALSKLSLTQQVKFKREGRKIIVMP